MRIKDCARSVLSRISNPISRKAIATVDERERHLLQILDDAFLGDSRLVLRTVPFVYLGDLVFEHQSFGRMVIHDVGSRAWARTLETAAPANATRGDQVGPWAAVQARCTASDDTYLSRRRM